MFHIKYFKQLSVYELYEILKLRAEVFVVEQGCIYNDFDDADYGSIHIFKFNQEKCIACARLLKPGIVYPQASIGRIIVASEARHEGLGKEITELSIETLYKEWGKQPIKINAQVYIQKMYEDLGFKVVEKPHIEDGILHVGMMLK